MNVCVCRTVGGAYHTEMYIPHRWLLLGFKREFQIDDGIRIFEVLSSQYLDLSSDEVLKAHHKAAAVEMLSEGACMYV